MVNNTPTRQALILSSLGIVYNSQGDYPRAIEFHERSLKIELVIHGEQHPNTPASYNNLGMKGFHKKKEFERALEFHTTAFKIFSSKLGDKHIETGQSHDNLALAYCALG